MDIEKSPEKQKQTMSVGEGGTSNRPVIVVVQRQNGNFGDKEYFAKKFPSKTVKILSAVHILVFIIMIITPIIGIHGSKNFYFGNGHLTFWDPLIFGLAGALGLLAVWKPTKCRYELYYIRYQVLSLFNWLLLRQVKICLLFNLQHNFIHGVEYHRCPHMHPQRNSRCPECFILCITYK